MAHTFQFVDKIHATPTVRLDLNADPWTLLGEGFDFSPPALRRAVAQTMMRSGGSVAASAYDLRILKFQLVLDASSADAAATEVQKLMRELDRSDSVELGGTSNYLKWQPGTTAPVFFRTYRSTPGAIRELRPRDQSRVFAVEVLADPFGFGLQEAAGLFTVNNDPAAVSNGMYFDLTGVKGDVDTPLILEIDAASGLADSTDKPVSILATRRHGTPGNAPFLLQAEAMTMNTDTATQANSASFSGASNNYVRTTFATSAAMVSRMSKKPVPAAASVDVRGQYRVFARYRLNSAAAGDIKFQLKWGAEGGVYENPIIIPPNSSGIAIADLGFVVFPPGGDAGNFGGTSLPVAGNYIDLYAQRVAGSGTLDIDYLIFVPCDDQMAIFDFPLTGLDLTPDEWVVHGPTETIYPQDSSGNIALVTSPVGLRGGFISARPGVTNRVYFLRHVAKQVSNDTITATTEIRVFYYPLYLYARPATT